MRSFGIGIQGQGLSLHYQRQGRKLHGQDQDLGHCILKDFSFQGLIYRLDVLPLITLFM